MTKTVLVVEDEPIIRMNAVATLEDAGYDVVEASNADDAIRLLEYRLDVKAVFSDIDMPGSMNGLALIHCVRKRWPLALLILVSGRFCPLACEMPPDTIFLKKPYTDTAVVEALRTIH